MLVLFWTLSSFPVCPLNWEDQNCTRYSRHGLKRAELSGIITSFILLVKIFLMQPTKQFAFATARMLCWFIWLALHQNPKVLLRRAKKKKSWLAIQIPDCIAAWIIPSQVQDFIFAKAHTVLVDAIFQIVKVCMVALPSSISLSAPSLVHMQTWAGCIHITFTSKWSCHPDHFQVSDVELTAEEIQ